MIIPNNERVVEFYYNGDLKYKVEIQKKIFCFKFWIEKKYLFCGVLQYSLAPVKPVYRKNFKRAIYFDSLNQCLNYKHPDSEAFKYKNNVIYKRLRTDNFKETWIISGIKETTLCLDFSQPKPFFGNTYQTISIYKEFLSKNDCIKYIDKAERQKSVKIISVLGDRKQKE